MEINECILKKKQSLVSNNNNFHKNETENEHVTNLFNKRFTLADNEPYTLPKLNSIFKYPLWHISELQALKKELNDVKNCLNNYDLDKWQLHTKLRNSAKDVMPRLKSNIQPELLTQAWCKFHEIVSSFPLVPIDYVRKNKNKFKSIHLCEAPGAFVTSLNHWLKTNEPNIKWDWTAMTLNPYYEGNSVSTMIDDDRFIRYTLDHWYFGPDNTGNIMELKNLNELIRQSMPYRENIFLVTADGSVDCADVPGEQESVLTHLHFCELVAALNLLESGGSFLLKMFTMFECNTVCLLYLLACCFTNVSVIKPATSKEGNSEVYIVCTNFKRPTIVPYLEKLKEYYECSPKYAMFNIQDIPSSFTKRIIECSIFFNLQQCLVIENNIITFNNPAYNSNSIQTTRQIQRSVADKYIRDYKIKRLQSGEIVGNAMMLMAKPANFNQCKTSMQGSYNERCEKQHLAPLERVESFCTDIEKVEIYLSHNDIKTYKFTEIPKELRIRTGKVFRKIRSSKFCSKLPLKILNGIDDVLAQMDMNYKIQFPSEESIQKLKTTIPPGHELLAFLYTNVYDSHRLIIQIHDTLRNLENGGSLILIGYSLLTHLSIELLYLIGCAFKKVEIMVLDNVGLKITLCEYTGNIKIMTYLDQLRQASFKAQTERTTILEIFHPLILYEGCRLCHSSDFNHWVIRAYVRYVLHVLKQKKFLTKYLV